MVRIETFHIQTYYTLNVTKPYTDIHSASVHKKVVYIKTSIW